MYILISQWNLIVVFYTYQYTLTDILAEVIINFTKIRDFLLLLLLEKN